MLPLYDVTIPELYVQIVSYTTVSMEEANFKKAEKYFAAAFSKPGQRVTVTDVRPYVRTAVFDKWGKVRVGNGGDLVRSCAAHLSHIQNRDASYVRVSL